MSPSKRSSRLALAILEQACGHVRAGEGSAQALLASTGPDHHLLALKRKLDLGSRMQTSPVSKLLRDDDLTLGPDSMSHTEQV
jgi:hypothetical protein